MRFGDAKKTADAFAGAAHVVQVTVVNQRVAALSIEPRSVLAWVAEDGRLTLRMSSQMPSGVRNSLANDILGIGRDQVRVTVGDVGGGFGMKTGIYPEDAAAAWAAWTLKRPVKWIADRSEEFLSSFHGRDQKAQAELALDATGRILALRLRTLANVGAYATATGMTIPMVVGPWVQTSVYDVPLIDFQIRCVLTNTASTAAYRGAGRPEAIFIMERLMDEAARQTGIDRVQLRRRNFVRPEQMPYKNAMGPGLRRRRVREDHGRGPGPRRLERLRAALCAEQGQRQAARPGHLDLPGVDQRDGLRGTGDGGGEGRRHDRGLLGREPDGAGHRDHARAAGGRRVRRSDRQGAGGAGRHDRGDGFGSAGSRSLFTGGSALYLGARRPGDRAQSRRAIPGGSATDLDYTGGRFSVKGTDVGIACSSWPRSSRPAHLHRATRARSPGRAGPTAAT
jgi:carbon-monoxide dehydrogenase large subunit